jgi:hypothetical protein
MSTEPRRPGKLRNGSSKAAEPAAAPVRTAQQVLAHLQDLRDTQDGFLIPMPPGLSAARLVEPVDVDERLKGQLVWNEPMKAAWRWLEAIAALGSPQDVQLGWELWRPPSGPSTINAKMNLFSRYEALLAECGKRWHALWQQAERETLAERAAAEVRSRLHRERDAAAAIRRDALAARDRTDRLEAELALLEREMGGETLQ